MLVYELLPFEGLSTRQLHDVLQLRGDVFVVEQECPYPEVDGRDPEALHLLGTHEGRLAAYCRWFAEDERTVLGRIVVAREGRGRGWGRALTREALRRIGNRTVRVHAQTRLDSFYRSLGFEPVGAPYDDFGVPHVRMDRPALSPGR
jgi:ElaA protein